MKKFDRKKLIIYQAKDGALELRADAGKETIWATQKQMAEVFGVDVRTINEHISNVYHSRELTKKATIRKFRIVQTEGNRHVRREVIHYNLDMAISVGYRINSKVATKFRQWATKTLKQHVTQGFTINPRRIEKNYKQFLKTVEDIKKLSVGNTQIQSGDILELVKSFAQTWFSLQSYDKEGLPKKGFTKKDIIIQADDLYRAVAVLKKELMKKKEATEMFAQERNGKNLEGILGNVLQSVFSKDVYGTVEEKAAHLLYFIVKNHPFTDGNKRTGAFTFIWFLQKAKLDFRSSITPEALAALTLLIAESNPKDKDRLVGLVLQLLKK